MPHALRPVVPVSRQGTLITVYFALISLALLAGGPRDYPNLHTILDTSAALLSGVVAWLLWDMGHRSSRQLPRLLAICFAITAGTKLVHVLVTVEWRGVFAAIKQAEMDLRPSTWPSAAYVLPVGILAACLVGERRSASPLRFGAALVAFAALALMAGHWFPPYTAPIVFGIRRPLLVGVPLLWLVVGWIGWRRRDLDPAMSPLACMSLILGIAGAAMLFSSAPHDGQAMVAHVGKVSGYVVLLLALVDMLAADTSARISAERMLGDVNAQLERRVADRTEQLATVNVSLRASEARTRAIIETALDAVVTIDATGIITGWSPQAERTFGWTHDEVIGRPLVETIVPPQHREAHVRGLARYLETGEASMLNRRLEISAVDCHEREFPIELSITALRVGQTVSFSAFIRDISDRMRTQQALIESRQHYRALSESLPNLVWTCRSDGWCDFLSRQWADYTGVPADEQLGYKWIERLHPDDRPRVQAAWTDTVVRGDVYDVEFRIRRADGVYRWFRTRAVPLRDAEGVIVKWFGSNTDVDDDKHAEQRLRSQVERLALLDQLTRAIGERQDLPSILDVAIHSLETDLPVDGCCACAVDRVDATLAVTRVGLKSAALLNLVGLREGARVPLDLDVLGSCLQGQLVYEPDLTAPPDDETHDASGDPGHPSAEPKDGIPAFPQCVYRLGLRSLVVAPLVVERQVLAVLIVARRSPDAFTSADCEFLRQLSEHVALAAHQAQLYAALKGAYDELRQTQQAIMQQERLSALGQMASGIAHDINNALSPVALYTESLLRTEVSLSPHGRESLVTIQRAVEDVAQTVARMREFYRQREPQLILLPVDVNRVLRDVLYLTRARWSDMPQQRGVVVRASADLALEQPTILGVESELREALINLIFNAVDALPDGGALVLRSRLVEGGPTTGLVTASRRVAIEVTDTGIGMDAETERRCLEPFFTTKGERGTGLGLAMVYGMAQRHRADIAVESKPGQGTTIRLTFAAADRVTVDVAPDPPAAHTSRLRVLAIDDDPLLLKSLSDALSGEGHLVTTASGGQAGIDLFRQARRDDAPFDVVITDLGMPHVDGRQVAEQIKAQSPDTHVILLTGWGPRLVDGGDAPATVDCVMNKPPKLSELRGVLAATSSDHP